MQQCVQVGVEFEVIEEQEVQGKEEEEEGKQLLLSSRVSPTVPPIGEVAPGWQAIDSLGAWDSFLGGGAGQVGAGRVRAGDHQGPHGAGLPPRGSAQEVGRREVAKSFLCVNQRDWGNLILFWQKDSEHYARFIEKRQGKRTKQEWGQQTTRLRKTVLGLLHNTRSPRQQTG